MEVLGLAAEFLDGQHSRAAVCLYFANYATGLMTKTLSVLALAVALLILAVALMIVDTEKVRARSTCPSGTQKFAHVCIEKSARTAAAFDNAS